MDYNYHFFTLFIFMIFISISFYKGQNIPINELKIETYPENIKKENLKK